MLCANDLLELGLLTEALQLGLNVPADLAIVGYDDIEFAARRSRINHCPAPRLVTVRRKHASGTP